MARHVWRGSALALVIAIVAYATAASSPACHFEAPRGNTFTLDALRRRMSPTHPDFAGAAANANIDEKKVADDALSMVADTLTSNWRPRLLAGARGAESKVSFDLWFRDST